MSLTRNISETVGYLGRQIWNGVKGMAGKSTAISNNIDITRTETGNPNNKYLYTITAPTFVHVPWKGRQPAGRHTIEMRDAVFQKTKWSETASFDTNGVAKIESNELTP